jgi:hypothetical protein
MQCFKRQAGPFYDGLRPTLPSGFVHAHPLGAIVLSPINTPDGAWVNLEKRRPVHVLDGDRGRPGLDARPPRALGQHRLRRSR